MACWAFWSLRGSRNYSECAHGLERLSERLGQKQLKHLNEVPQGGRRDHKSWEGAYLGWWCGSWERLEQWL